MVLSGTEVHLVMGPDGIVLRAYKHAGHAQVHARAVTGAVVVSVDVTDRLDEAIADDLEAEQEWDDDGDTPVHDVPFPDAEEEDR